MRTATPEQKAKAQERRERIRKLAKTIADMAETDRLQLAQSHGLRTIEGRELSVFNHCLLLTQNPNISVLGGFRQWKKAGRSVIKGQHGLSLWCPVSAKDKPDSDDIDEKRTRFILGTVFDVAQTSEIESEDTNE